MPINTFFNTCHSFEWPQNKRFSSQSHWEFYSNAFLTEPKPLPVPPSSRERDDPNRVACGQKKATTGHWLAQLTALEMDNPIVLNFLPCQLLSNSCATGHLHYTSSPQCIPACPLPCLPVECPVSPMSSSNSVYKSLVCCETINWISSPCSSPTIYPLNAQHRRYQDHFKTRESVK